MGRHDVRRLLCLLAASMCGGCQDGQSPLPPGSQLPGGTWGGDGAGLIVQQAAAHAHVGCTYGDFTAPIRLDREGRFAVEGSYLLRAYPIAVGPPLPATFSGVVRGTQLTFAVTVNDTVQDNVVVLGPVTLVLGRDPRMGPCPICLEPPSALPM